MSAVRSRRTRIASRICASTCHLEVSPPQGAPHQPRGSEPAKRLEWRVAAGPPEVKTMGVEPGAFPRRVERDTQRLRRRCRGSCFDLHTQELRGFWGGLSAANSSSLAGVPGHPRAHALSVAVLVSRQCAKARLRTAAPAYGARELAHHSSKPGLTN